MEHKISVDTSNAAVQYRTCFISPKILSSVKVKSNWFIVWFGIPTLPSLNASVKLIEFLSKTSHNIVPQQCQPTQVYIQNVCLGRGFKYVCEVRAQWITQPKYRSFCSPWKFIIHPSPICICLFCCVWLRIHTMLGLIHTILKIFESTSLSREKYKHKGL